MDGTRYALQQIKDLKLKIYLQQQCKGVTNFKFKTQEKCEFNLKEQGMEISLNKEYFINSILNKVDDFGAAIERGWENSMRQAWN